MVPNNSLQADPTKDEVLSALTVLDDKTQLGFLDKIDAHGGVTDELRLEIARAIRTRVGALDAYDEEEAAIRGARESMTRVMPVSAEDAAISEQMDQNDLAELDQSYTQFTAHREGILRSTIAAQADSAQAEADAKYKQILEEVKRDNKNIRNGGDPLNN